MPDYRILVNDLNGVAQDEFMPSNLQYAFALGEAGTVGFVLPFSHEKCIKSLLDPGKREIIVYRDGVKKWGGYLLNASASSGNDEVRFSGEGWFSRFLRRYIKDTLKYEDVDQLNIAWNIINNVQQQTNGSMGVTRFSADLSGVTRTRKYKPWERIVLGDELQALSEARDGFDFEVTPDKQWKTYYPDKGVETDFVFELGVNVTTLSYDIDASDIVSELTGLGAGDGKNRCIATWQANQTVTDYGLLQEAVDFGEIKHYGTMSSLVRGHLRQHKFPRTYPQMVIEIDEPPFDSYGLGDRIRVIANMGYMTFDETMKLVSSNVQVSNEGREVIQLFFDQIPITTDEVAV